MKKEKFALFMIIDDDRGIRQMHLMCNEGEDEDAWRGILAAVSCQALEECPQIFDVSCDKEVNYES